MLVSLGRPVSLKWEDSLKSNYVNVSFHRYGNFLTRMKWFVKSYCMADLNPEFKFLFNSVLFVLNSTICLLDINVLVTLLSYYFFLFNDNNLPGS